MSTLHQESAPVEPPPFSLADWLDRGARGDDEPPALDDSDYFDLGDLVLDEDRAGEAAWYDLAHNRFLP